MKNIVLLFLFLQFFSHVSLFSDEKINNLRCEYLTNPISIDVAAPRFSWESLVIQEYYQLHVATDKKTLQTGDADVWQSERLTGDANTLTFGGKPLNSHSTYYWKVSVWGILNTKMGRKVSL